MTDSLDRKAEGELLFNRIQTSIRNYNTASKVGVVGLTLFGIWMTYMTYVNQMNHADNCQYPSSQEMGKINQYPTF